MGSKIVEELENIVFEFDRERAEEVAGKALAEGIDPVKCAATLSDALRLIGDKFGRGEMFLPELVNASEVVKAALPIIIAEIKKQGKNVQTLGKVIIGTVFGDIHNIGKSMVATLLFAEGFEINDLGVNVKSDEFLNAVTRHNPDILAMSALLTTTSMEQKNVIEGLKKRGIREKVKVLVGGSPINQEFADRIGADGYGATAPDGVRVARKLIGK
ncbi:MAG: cobalamin-dependent protein [Spirochaetota bacterium]